MQLPFKLKQKQEIEVTVSNRTILRILALILVFILFLTLLKALSHALLLLAIAFFLSLALNAPVHWIDEHLPGKKRRTRALATVVSALIVVVILAVFLMSVVPPILHQIGNFVSAIPDYVHQFQDHNSAFNQFVNHYHLQNQVDMFTQQVSERTRSLSGGAVSALGSIGSSIVAGLTVLVLTFMMLVEGPHWVETTERILPKKHRSRVADLSRDMYQVIRGYINGQVILALLASLFIVPILFIFHVSYPLALAFIVFVCGLIPLIGHTIGAIIVTAVSLFSVSPVVAGVILVYYIFYQQVENYLIQPKLQASHTNMSPLLVFVAVVLGVSFGGLFGALVAIPVMGCIKVLVVDILRRRKILEDETSSEVTLAKAETK